MYNVDFLKRVILSVSEYWIVSKKNEFNGRRDKDSIIFISIPQGTPRKSEEGQILLSSVENLRRSEVANIHLNDSFSPFQMYCTLHDVYDGYPVVGDPKKALTDALALQSDNLWDYKAIADPSLKKEVEKV